MKNKFHGVFSLGLFMTGCFLAFYVLLAYSLTIALIYGIVLVLAPAAIVGFYCAKCPCRLTNCGHLFPGKMTKIFPKRNEGKYSVLDKSIVVIAVLAMIGMPQYWLWKMPVYCVIFWAAIAIAMVQINRFVCPNCDNNFCIANKKYIG